MSFLKIKSHGQSVTESDEFLISSADDVENLPDESAPGSVAYTADLSYVAMKDIDGEWKAAVAPEETTDAEEE